MTDSRRKGANGELELHKLLAEQLVKEEHIQRTGLMQAGGGGFDLVIPYLGIEVKRRAKAISYADIAKFWTQVQEQTELIDVVGILAFRSDRQPWQFVLPAMLVEPEWNEDGPSHMTWSFVMDLELTHTVYLEGFKQWYVSACAALKATQPETLNG
jgi:hypothetical protein